VGGLNVENKTKAEGNEQGKKEGRENALWTKL
jgi:hypothetical protein